LTPLSAWGIASRMAGQLENKVALVIGASSGIGRSTAIVLARAGAKVALAARREAESEAVVEEIKASGGEATFIKTDVAVPEEIEALIQKTVERYGRLDCAFNNAGISEDFVPLADLPDETFDRIVNINMKSVFVSMKHELRQMVKQGSGTIVNNASYLGLIAAPAGAVYAATKHAVIGMTKSAALGYAKKGIRVNAVCPTAIADTSIVEGLLANHADLMDSYVDQIPLGRMGRSAEVAEAVLWLLSDASSLVTGHALAVDGGQVVQ
jgi:NAD(P)-dependent dehydrogenase (short-subunit alcohol dehydrogenase family)